MACFCVFLTIKNRVVEPNVVKSVSNVNVSVENEIPELVSNLSFLHDGKMNVSKMKIHCHCNCCNANFAIALFD